MPTRLRLATFNLEDLGGTGHDRPLLEDRIAALRPILMRLDADVLCLQEVNAQALPAHRGRALAALNRVLENTPYATYERIASTASRGDHLADKHNLVLLSRFPIVQTRQIRHDLWPPMAYCPVTALTDASQPEKLPFDRPVLYAAIALLNGRNLHVLNLHLKAPLAAAIAGQKESALVWKTVSGWAEGFFLASVKRSGQALEARLVVDQIFDTEPDALVAVCGDYNAEGHEVPVRLIRGDVDDTGNSRLTSRVLTALDDKLPPQRRYSVLHDGRRVLLDHVLVSRSLLAICHSSEVFNDELPDEAVNGAAGIAVAGSFHAPMAAEFVLPD